MAFSTDVPCKLSTSYLRRIRKDDQIPLNVELFLPGGKCSEDIQGIPCFVDSELLENSFGFGEVVSEKLSPFQWADTKKHPSVEEIWRFCYPPRQEQYKDLKEEREKRSLKALQSQLKRGALIYNESAEAVRAQHLKRKAISFAIPADQLVQDPIPVFSISFMSVASADRKKSPPLKKRRLVKRPKKHNKMKSNSKQAESDQDASILEEEIRKIGEACKESKKVQKRRRKLQKDLHIKNLS
ncbi:hypothetical protein ACLOJK_029665 [Asimina triloba]